MILPDTGTFAVPAALLLAGLAGSGHCFAMCGGIAALGGQQSQGSHLIWLFNGGRVLAYTLVGGLGAWLTAAGLSQLFPAFAALLLRSLAGVLLILVGLTLLGHHQALGSLNRLGGRVWQHIRPLTRHFLPLKNAPGALLLGTLWGWLPCGLVYAVLPIAWSSGSGVSGGLGMLAFGLGTLPSMALTALGAARFRGAFKQPRVRQLSGVLIILAGLWLIAAALYFSSHRH